MRSEQDTVIRDISIDNAASKSTKCRSGRNKLLTITIIIVIKMKITDAT